MLVENLKLLKGEDWNLCVEFVRVFIIVVVEEDNVVCNIIFGVVVCYMVLVFVVVVDFVFEVGKRVFGRRG